MHTTLRTRGRPRNGTRPMYDLNDMVAQFHKGQTLQAIGDFYGVSRERVRQILTKAGVKSTDGGYKKIAATNRVLEERRVMMNKIRRAAAYDLTVDEFIAHGPVATIGTDLYRYNMFKGYVKRTYNQAVLSFPEWLSLWKNSGKELGAGWCLSRKDFQGSWSRENLRIISQTQLT